MLTVTTIIIVSLSIKNLWSALERKTNADMEHLLQLMSSQINNSLLTADSFLRYLVYMNNQSLTDQGLEFLRQELILHPEISYLKVFNGTGQVLWKSVFSPDSNEVYTLLSQYHSNNQVDFVLLQGNHDVDNYIHLSRVIFDEQGYIKYLFEIGLNDQSLFPSPEDPSMSNIFNISLWDAKFSLLLERNYKQTKSFADIEIYNGEEKVASSLTGGTHIRSFKKYTQGIQQLNAFPLYFTMVMDRNPDIRNFQKQSGLLIGLFLTFSAITWVLSFMYQQQKYNKSLGIQNDNLQELNKKLEKTSKERKLLIQEIHHRVKNNLALINHIISLITDEGGPYTEQTLKDLSARIIAIQNVHDTLYKSSDLSQIEIPQYLTEITTMILSSVCQFPVAVENNMNKFTLPAKRVIPLGILTAEIITNAIKYGLLPGGTISFNGGFQEQNMILLRISNDGKPYQDGHRGLGSDLIEALVSQLEGDMELETGEKTTFSIHFPRDDQ